MILTFTPEKHEYKSLGEDIDWIGVTTFISHFKEPFNAELQAKKSSKNKRSKWYGIPPEEILTIWRNEADRSSTLGNWYHDQRESDIIEFKTLNRFGVDIPIIKPLYKDGIKHAPDQKLKDGVYPEHLVYLKSAGICGQSDRVEVVKKKVYISDYKSNKEIKLEGYTNWEGITSKMADPISHLDECHIVQYGLQLSLYLYIILKHNPQLSPGKLTIDHVIFEEKAKDKYGYPIYRQDKHGNYIIKDIVHYPVPYYKAEILSMIKYLKDNRELIKSKK